MGGGSLSMSLSRSFHRENDKGTLIPYICGGTWADDWSVGDVRFILDGVRMVTLCAKPVKHICSDLPQKPNARPKRASLTEIGWADALDLARRDLLCAVIFRKAGRLIQHEPTATGSSRVLFQITVIVASSNVRRVRRRPTSPRTGTAESNCRSDSN